MLQIDPGPIHSNKSGAAQPGSWTDAALAAGPHLAVLALALLPLGGLTVGSAFVPFMLPAALALLAAVLAVAWRRGWPVWSAGWLADAALLGALAAVVVLQRFAGEAATRIGTDLLLPLAGAVGLCWVAGRDPLKGLLAGLPAVILFWYPVLEFVREPLHEILVLGMLALAALLAAAIVRLNLPAEGAWLIIGASLAAGLLAAGARTFLNNLPPEHAGPGGLIEFAGHFAPQWISSGALVIGPLWVWRVRAAGAGRSLYRLLALAGLALNLSGTLGYLWQQASITGPGLAWFGGLAAAGALLGCAAALALGRAARDRRLAALGLLAAALPFMWMLPAWLNGRFGPYALDEAGTYLLYSICLAWLAAGIWLAAGRGLPGLTRGAP